jgi:PAS domain S-box-containing protein
MGGERTTSEHDVLIAGSRPADTQETLRQKRDIAAAILDTAGALIVVLDQGGRIVRFNQACERTTGYSQKEVTGKCVWDLFLLPQERKSVQAVFSQLRAGAYPNEFENYWITRNGGRRLIKWANTALLDDSGQVEYVIGTGIDVTEQRQARETLQKLSHELGERVKELDCLYAMSALVEKPGVTLSEILQGTVDLLPPAFQYPEIVCARILLDDLEFRTANFLETAWRLTRGIWVRGQRAGQLQVCCLEKRQNEGRGPFLKEEKSLIGAIAERLGVIVERAQAQEALKRNEERYALAQRAAHIGSWDWDVQSGDLRWSDQIEPMFGFGRGEFGATYEAFLECVHPKDREYVIGSVDACVQRGADYAIEHRIVWPDGTVRWVSEIGDVIRDERGQAIRMLGVVQDITERKQAEQQIRGHDAFLTSVVESLTHPFYVVRIADYTIEMANTAAYPGGLPEQSKCYALFHNLDRPCGELGAVCPIEEIQRTKGPVTVEHVHYDANGNLRNIEVRCYPLFDDEGTAVRVIEYSLDITQRKQAEEALREAKEAAEHARREEQERRQEADRRRRIAESLAGVLVALNSDRSLDQVLDHIAAQAKQLLDNQAVAIYRLNGEAGTPDLQATQGLDVDGMAIASEPLGIGALRQAVTSRQAVAVPDLAVELAQPLSGAELQVPDSPGVEPFRSLLALPIVVQDQVYGGLLLYYAHPRSFSDEEMELAAVFGDQVALAVGNARLKEQVQQTAVAAERSRLGRDLHDSVTQALFSACLVAEVLPNVWRRDPEQAWQGIEELRQLTRGALAEMRTLLLELRPAALVQTGLDDLLRQLAETVNSRAQSSCHLNIEPSPVLPPEVHVTFYRVAQEALRNVAKHARAGQVTVSLQVSPPVDRQRAGAWQGRIVLCIKDDGEGFDWGEVGPDQLGLDIMRERATMVGGSLTIQSQPGQGTEVILVWESGP